MNTVIYKYELMLADSQTLELPIDHQILSAGLDPQGQLCIWVEVDPNILTKFPRRIFIIGTGDPMPTTEKTFISTVFDGLYIWHIYAEVL